MPDKSFLAFHKYVFLRFLFVFVLSTYVFLGCSSVFVRGSSVFIVYVEGYESLKCCSVSLYDSTRYFV